MSIVLTSDSVALGHVCYNVQGFPGVSASEAEVYCLDN